MNKLLIFTFLSISSISFNNLNAEGTERVVGESKMHPLTKALANNGVVDCLDRANQISNFISGAGVHQVLFQPPKDNPNKRLLMSTMILNSTQKDSKVASLALAPNQANGCGGSYRTISYSSDSCQKYINQNFPKLKFQAFPNSAVQLGVFERGLWVIAMPADNGCVAIKEELVE